MACVSGTSSWQRGTLAEDVTGQKAHGYRGLPTVQPGLGLLPKGHQAPDL